MTSTGSQQREQHFIFELSTWRALWGTMCLWCFCSTESPRLGRKQPSTKESGIKTLPGGITTALPALPTIAQGTIGYRVLKGHNMQKKPELYLNFVYDRFPTDQLETAFQLSARHEQQTIKASWKQICYFEKPTWRFPVKSTVLKIIRWDGWVKQVILPIAPPLCLDLYTHQPLN